MSRIEWTEQTWNPMIGCSKVSAGCQNCYAMSIAHRLASNPNEDISTAYRRLTKKVGGKTTWTGKVNFIEYRLPMVERRKPTMFFVNSMSDLFHESLDFIDILQVFEAILDNSQHIYQILTKRPQRAIEFFEYAIKKVYFPETLSQVWFGVSVENREACDRIQYLNQLPVRVGVRWISAEPLIQGIDPFDAPGGEAIDWVVVGGESGHNARPFCLEWARRLQSQCCDRCIPFFFKQTGSNAYYETRDRLKLPGKGNDISKLPVEFVRQMPLAR